jgi:hypothetical protein
MLELRIDPAEGQGAHARLSMNGHRAVLEVLRDRDFREAELYQDGEYAFSLTIEEGYWLLFDRDGIERTIRQAP